MMAAAIVPDVVLDTLGLFCPIPIILTARRIKQMAPGQTLEVRSDDEGMKKDVTEWCRMTGHDLLDVMQHDRVITAYIRK